MEVMPLYDACFVLSVLCIATAGTLIGFEVVGEMRPLETKATCGNLLRVWREVLIPYEVVLIPSILMMLTGSVICIVALISGETELPGVADMFIQVSNLQMVIIIAPPYAGTPCLLAAAMQRRKGLIK